VVRSAIIAAASLAFVLVPAAASAVGNAPPPGNGPSAVWQYVEVVPTSRGPHVETGNARPGPKLPPKVDVQLGQTPVDKALRNAARSERYGAPTAVARAKVPSRATPHVTVSAAGAATTPVPSVVTERLVVLLALLAGSTLLGFGYRFRRRNN
jgi:hypothetical protein